MDYSFIREKFDINSISKSILSIQVSLDGFSFVITTAEHQQYPDYIYINRIENNDSEKLTMALSSFRGFDLKEFYAIRIIVHEAVFALVPDTFFDPKDINAYLNLNHPSIVNRKILSNRITLANAVCIFSMDQKLYDLLKKKYPEAEFCHTSLPFCTMALNKSNDACFIQCYEKSLELSIIKAQKLVLYNIFDLHDGNDIVYYVLNAYKSINLDPLIHPLFIAGILAKDAEAISIAEKYIKNIHFYTNDSVIVPGSGEFHYPLHYFLNHWEILNCEL